MELIDFSLEKALAHPDRVVTRFGIPVRAISHTGNMFYTKIHATLESGVVVSYYVNGRYRSWSREDGLDLMLLPEDAGKNVPMELTFDELEQEAKNSGSDVDFNGQFIQGMVRAVRVLNRKYRGIQQ